MKLVIEVETTDLTQVEQALKVLSLVRYADDMKLGLERRDSETSPEVPEKAPTEKKIETKAKPKPTTKKAVEPKPEPKEEVPEKATIGLADLKESAKNAVARSSREEVKEVISKYAVKLAEVSEEDYGKCYKMLQELGK